MEAFYNLQVCEQLSPALRKSDIICTATGSTEPLVHLQDLQPHVHIDAIDSHHRSM